MSIKFFSPQRFLKNSRDHFSHQSVAPKNTFVFTSKKIIIPFLFSLILGLLLGIFMLFLFPNIGDDLPTGVPEVENKDEENLGKTVNLDLINYEVVFPTVYVLQAGVFSSMDNAKEWLDSIEALKNRTIVWERDSHFYLFAGIAHDEERAEIIKDKHFQEDLDLYIKQWLVDPIEIVSSEAEIKWINSFLDIWRLTLDDHSKFSNWEQVIEEGKTIEGFKDFSQEIAQLLKENDYRSERDANYLLLKIWKDFKKTAMNVKD